MTGLTVAHRAALAQVIGGVPDRTLDQLALMVAGMPGDRARGLEELLADETRDRRRRDRAFAPLAPLFQPRPDGVAANVFPGPVMGRLWKAASAREPELLPALDEWATSRRIRAASPSWANRMSSSRRVPSGATAAASRTSRRSSASLSASGRPTQAGRDGSPRRTRGARSQHPASSTRAA